MKQKLKRHHSLFTAVKENNIQFCKSTLADIAENESGFDYDIWGYENVLIFLMAIHCGYSEIVSLLITNFDGNVLAFEYQYAREEPSIDNYSVKLEEKEMPRGPDSFLNLLLNKKQFCLAFELSERLCEYKHSTSFTMQEKLLLTSSLQYNLHAFEWITSTANFVYSISSLQSIIMRFIKETVEDAETNKNSAIFLKLLINFLKIHIP